MRNIHSVRTVITGGVYRERCMHPFSDEIYGSAGRAASAMASMGAQVALHSYLDASTKEVLAVRAAMEEFRLTEATVQRSVTFDYDHGLAVPRIFCGRESEPALQVEAPNVLRFGFLEGDAIVHGERVVYDPQNAVGAKAFHENGSTAGELALVLNCSEAAQLSGLAAASVEAMAQALIESAQAQVVVIKQGPRGAFVYDGKTADWVPAYRSSAVWKIGSGDNFAAHFAFRWMHENRSAAESANLASRATAYYCQNRGGFATAETMDSFNPEPIQPSGRFLEGYRPKVYLAGPFFTLAQLWLVEQARGNLIGMGLDVFSPYHDVGPGPAEEVVEKDLLALDEADVVLAIADGMDSGTIYEVGYARAKGTPVIIYSERESEENLKMMAGSDCVICEDYVSAVYHTVWEASAR